MMIIKYNADISNNSIDRNLQRLINQTYKLLPDREEGQEWRKPLSAIIEEFAGMARLLSDKHTILFELLCKLEGLNTLGEPDDFQLYRRTIFECISLIGDIRNVRNK